MGLEEVDYVSFCKTCVGGLDKNPTPLRLTFYSESQANNGAIQCLEGALATPRIRQGRKKQNQPPSHPLAVICSLTKVAPESGGGKVGQLDVIWGKTTLSPEPPVFTVMICHDVLFLYVCMILTSQLCIYRSFHPQGVLQSIIFPRTLGSRQGRHY